MLGSPQGVPKVPKESLRSPQGFPRSPQGVPKESLWSSPSITLVLLDSKDSPRTPQGVLKDFIGSPQGVPQDSLYNPHKEGTFPGVHKESLRTPCIILIKRGLFRESPYSPTGTDQGLRKDSHNLIWGKKTFVFSQIRTLDLIDQPGGIINAALNRWTIGP